MQSGSAPRCPASRRLGEWGFAMTSRVGGLGASDRLWWPRCRLRAEGGAVSVRDLMAVRVRKINALCNGRERMQFRRE